MNSIILIFKNNVVGTTSDIEVPKNITANELIVGLNAGLRLGMNTNNSAECYLCAQNPRNLVRGNKTLEELGFRNGTVLIYNPR